MKKIALGMMMGVLAACTPVEQESQVEDASALCAQATEHAKGCFPGEAIEAPATCDAAQAKALLDSSCESLQASDGGKADGFCNPWFWWTCVGGGSSSSTASFWVSVNACDDEFCTATWGDAKCARVTLEDDTGEVLATGFSNNNANVRFEDIEIEDGTYTLRLWRRDGEQAQIFGGTIGDVRPEPAVLSVTIEDGEATRRPRFHILRDEAELVRGCATVRGTLDSTCDGEPMDKEDIEWGWFVRMEGETEAGEFVDTTRSFKAFQAENHGYSIPLVMPGTYRLSFLEMDIPSWRRKNNPDYDALVRSSATGRTITETVEITADDILSQDISFSTIELDHQECR